MLQYPKQAYKGYGNKVNKYAKMVLFFFYIFIYTVEKTTRNICINKNMCKVCIDLIDRGHDFLNFLDRRTR